MSNQLITSNQEVNYTMAWQKQAERRTIKALKAQLSTFENKYNLQVLQNKKRNRDWKEESIKTRIETKGKKALEPKAVAIEKKNPLKQGLKR